MIFIMLNVCSNFCLNKYVITLELIYLVFFPSLYVRFLYISAGTLVAEFLIHFGTSFAN